MVLLEKWNRLGADTPALIEALVASRRSSLCGWSAWSDGAMRHRVRVACTMHDNWFCVAGVAVVGGANGSIKKTVFRQNELIKKWPKRINGNGTFSQAETEAMRFYGISSKKGVPPLPPRWPSALPRT